MSTKNDKSAIVIIVFATLFVLFAFVKQFEQKPVSQIVYVKYILVGPYLNTYMFESNIDYKCYSVEVSKSDYDKVNQGDSYSGKWKVKN